jgi:hypothetical protein
MRHGPGSARQSPGLVLAAGLGVTFFFMVWSSSCVSARALEHGGDQRAQNRPWPCRLIVEPPLLGIVEEAWRRAPTLRRQCDELAGAHAAVVLEWGTVDSQSRAVTRMTVRDGVVVARVSVPPVRDAVEHVAHELQHVIEQVRGVDFAAEAERPGSGVWRAFGGFETQGAIDAGRQVVKELHDAGMRGER